MSDTSFIRSIRLDGFLSFAPGSERIDLAPLNVVIGPNGSGKSNLIEAIELLHAAPTAFAAAIRDGGGVQEWLWNGEKPKDPAVIEAIIQGSPPMIPDLPEAVRRRERIARQIIQDSLPMIPDLRYRLAFAASGYRTEVVDEAIEEPEKRHASEKDVFFYYRFQHGRPVLCVRTVSGGREKRSLQREDLKPDESVLSQRKDPDFYPEVTWLGRRFEQIQTFREWSFGRYAPLRQPQPADMPSSPLLPDSRNLGLLLNEIEHIDADAELNRLLTLFLPRYQRFSTRIQGGSVQFYLHERGLLAPIPATRLSDGTIRFMAILALLLSPSPPPLICIEEPELGLHPDAVALLAELLIDSAERTQLVVTTHSDAVLSAFTEHPSSVLVCEHRNGTVLERLDPERLTFWLEAYRLEEVWRIGEFGGNP